MPRNIIVGAKTNPEKIHRARELRRTMTPGEKMLWTRLRANQLHGYHFRRQQVIAGLIADFYCHAAGLVIEVDGGIHNTRIEEDAVRDAIIQDLGLTILRMKEEEVLSDIEAVLARIADACEVSRTYPPSVPIPVRHAVAPGRGSGKPQHTRKLHFSAGVRSSSK